VLPLLPRRRNDSPAHAGAVAIAGEHDDLVRRLARRYFAVFVAVAALVAADQAIIQPLLLRMSAYAPAINIAGRQRMLSQKLAKAALAWDAAENDAERDAYRREVAEALDQWSTAHRALGQGVREGVDGASQAGQLIVLATPATTRAWAELEPHFDAMQAAARVVASSEGPAADDHAVNVRTIVDHEPLFLAAMERVVGLMEIQSASELQRLRMFALVIAAAVVLLLAGLNWAVVRPATQAIRRQVDELESQVAVRTRELDDALASLRREVEEHAAADERSRALAAQLGHADRIESMGRLATGLAHELNQPLGAIANFASAARVVLAAPREAVDHGRLADFAVQIETAALRAGHIVRRMRNFVRGGAPTASTVRLGALVAEVIDLCRPEAARAEVELSLHLPTDDPAVTVDPIQIQQVVVNLIQNALQAMEHAPPQRRRLTVRVVAANGAVQIDVIDGGPGLAGQDSEILFAPFHTTKPEGLGVGLSICRAIVEQHQGTIWAKSLQDAGAQFSFVLPLADAHVEPALA
jgi:two-component system sensor kinase FixL